MKRNVEIQTKIFHLEPPTLQKLMKLMNIPQMTAHIAQRLMKRRQHIMVKSDFVVRSTQVWSLVGKLQNSFVPQFPHL